MGSAPTYAVIGAGYGDEGKGLMTDALAARLGPESFVIRFNGGAQAGHTVVMPDGRRHVFHHVGSGSFAGATTGLSKHFVSNPHVLSEELAQLAGLGVRPRIVADERGLLTTPWDMMINQFIEEERGTARHGSCGLGVGETVERSLRPEYATTLADLRGDVDVLRTRFEAIRSEWVPKRLTRLGVPQLWLKNRGLIMAPKTLERALAEAVGMLEHVDIAPRLAPPKGAPVIFEGAQGLMLDQTIGHFPYVTRSNTGLLNIADVMEECGMERLEVFYMTRAYVTRHGAGPLAHEQPGPPSERFSDPTNVPNPWQGTLRFGLLDLDVLGRAIRADLASVNGRGLDVAPRLAVTCLNQIDEARWVKGGVKKTGDEVALLAALRDHLPVSSEIAVSRSPTREMTTRRSIQRKKNDAVA